MLTSIEKENLYLVIASIIGHDPSIKSRTQRFNMRTVTTVETMVKTSNDCNESMKKLASSLVGPSSFLTKGWLIKLLKIMKTTIPVGKLNGQGCKVVVKSRWKTALIYSTI